MVGNTLVDAPSGAKEIRVEKIIPNPRQPRGSFDSESLGELAASIQEHGERRLLAAKQAGLETVPIIVREASDQDRLELALIENVQRTDLSPIETAKAYQQLNQIFNLSHDDIAKRVGKSRTAISNTLRLLNLPTIVQQAIIDGKISEGHARAILGLPTAQSQSAALSTVLAKDLNVRQTEILVRKLNGDKPILTPVVEDPPEIKALEERLQTALGTKVRLKHGVKGGTITVHYYSNEELDVLANIFLNNAE
jgi:ParB family chromosome partitioning protein